MRTSPQRLLAAVVFVGVVVGITLRSSLDTARAANSAAIGVWRVAEETTTGPNGRKNTNPQPGVLIFTQRYYSVNEVTANAPRPELPPPDKRTDKQVADAFGPFTGQAGTYEIKGNELTYRPIAAKNPNVMRAGHFFVDTFRMEGNNTLWLTGKANNAGPIANPGTTKLTRLE